MPQAGHLHERETTHSAPPPRAHLPASSLPPIHPAPSTPVPLQRVRLLSFADLEEGLSRAQQEVAKIVEEHPTIRKASEAAAGGVAFAPHAPHHAERGGHAQSAPAVPGGAGKKGEGRGAGGVEGKEGSRSSGSSGGAKEGLKTQSSLSAVLGGLGKMMPGGRKKGNRNALSLAAVVAVKRNAGHVHEVVAERTRARKNVSPFDVLGLVLEMK